MKWSQAFIPTLKEVPAEAVIPSHQYMLRAGLIRKVGSGLYIYLPLGYKALRKIEEITREEMDRAGALEFSIPLLVPVELWEESGRWNPGKMELMRAKDRHGRMVVLSPTNEESFTDLFRKEIQSYKQLPVNFYQINTKFRDEIRPRYGVMRAKEFVMKDAYSFNLDEESLRESYERMRVAYEKIFNRCRLKTVRVKADSGDMGGNASEEFMVESEVGEDEIVTCPCGYVANVETAEAALVPGDGVDEVFCGMEKISTPSVKTIEELTDFLKIPASRFIKTLIYQADERTIVVLIRGDLEVNETKLINELGATELNLAGNDVIEELTGAPVGFAGPVGLKDSVDIIADESVKTIVNGITGANEEDYHYKNVNMDRDFKVVRTADLRLARKGDRCVHCGKELNVYRGIELGHIFQLGKKYTESMKVKVLDKNGKEAVPFMGCYGIGITRTLAAVIEQHHDEKGIVWPMALAPYQVVILPLNTGSEKAMALAAEYEEKLTEAGYDVLVDDRKVSPGFKFKDSELIGVPVRINLGDRSLKENQVEVVLRREGKTVKVDCEKAMEYVIKLIDNESKTQGN